MEILLVILSAIVVLASAMILFKTIYWQRKLNLRLNLSHDKNNVVLFKQGGVLLATMLLFGVTVSQPVILNKLLPTTSSGVRDLSDIRYALSEHVSGLGVDPNNNGEPSDDVDVVKTVTFDQPLPAGNYSIVVYGEQWYLVSENQEFILNIKDKD